MNDSISLFTPQKNKTKLKAKYRKWLAKQLQCILNDILVIRNKLWYHYMILQFISLYYF